MDALGQALQECSGCIVFLGPGGDAPWHHEEVRSALNHAIRDRSYRVIPVLLPGARQERLSHLPEFLANRQWVEFPRLDDPNAIHRLVCGIQGVEPGRAMGGSHTPGRNPYRGLRFFEVGDAPLFFGREVLTQELLAKLARESRFVSIVGPSGSGKSSLVRAGLLASLGAGRLPGSAEWPQVIIRPGAFPLESLAVGLASKLVAGIDPSELIRRLEAGEEALHREVRTALQSRPEFRAVLLVDQAEEAFTQGMRDADRAAFFANLVYAATVRGGHLVVVLAFRADFFPRFAEYRQLAALVSENLLLVPPMSEYELRRAIVSPAERSGRPLRPALVDELLSDVSGRPGSLPLLEHALARLWERPELVLGIEEYRSIGGVSGALNSRAEEVFGKLTSSQQATCRRLFLRLIQHGADALDTRRRVRGTELPADQREVIQAFAAEGVHLLTWSREGEHEFLEVAHEELLRRWERLQRWAAEDRSGQRVHRRLTASAAEWSARAPLNRDESFLYRGAVLKEVEEWLARLPGGDRRNILNRDEAAFLEQSQIARDRSRAVRDRLAQDARRTADSPTRVVLAPEQLAEMEEAEADYGSPRRAPLALLLALLFLAAGVLVAGRVGYVYYQRQGGKAASSGGGVLVEATPLNAALALNGKQIPNAEVSYWPPGDYELSVKAPGYEPQTQKVEVERDIVILRIHLQKVPPATPDRSPPSAQERAVPASFSAHFTSTPSGAEIRLEGKAMGITPTAHANNLSPVKTYKFTAKLAGYRTYEGTLEADGQPEKQVEIALEPDLEQRNREWERTMQAKATQAKGMLACSSNPAGAEVFVDNKSTGRQTPIPIAKPLELTVGPHKVTFRLHGKTSQVMSVEIKQDEVSTLPNIQVE